MVDTGQSNYQGGFSIQLGLQLSAMPHDERYFPQTGHRVDKDLIWSYLQARGGVVNQYFDVLGARTRKAMATGRTNRCRTAPRRASPTT